jgi:hypothetical protein
VDIGAFDWDVNMKVATFCHKVVHYLFDQIRLENLGYAWPFGLVFP